MSPKPVIDQGEEIAQCYEPWVVVHDDSIGVTYTECSTYEETLANLRRHSRLYARGLTIYQQIPISGVGLEEASDLFGVFDEFLGLRHQRNVHWKAELTALDM